MPADDNISMGGTGGLTGEMGEPAPAAAAPPPQPIASDSSAMIQPQDAPDIPAIQTPTQPHGVMKILDFVGNLLTGGGNNPDVISRDPNTGARVVTPGSKMTTGQKFRQVGLNALEGAAAAASAPPGPGHTGRGVANAVELQLSQQHDREQKAEQMADKDYDEQQKTKMNNLNYQLLSRELISKQLADERAGHTADREQTDFSNRLQDRERALGSYDLGFVKDAKTIADLGNANPGMIAKYHQGLIVPIPVYGENGKTLGLQVFERKPNANASPLPQGQQIHRFTPPEKPGDAPKYEMYTPTNMSVAEATNADMKAYNDYQNYQDAQRKQEESKATIAEKKAQTNKANADADNSRAKTKNLLEGRTEQGKDEAPQGAHKVPADVTKRAALAANVNENIGKVNELLAHGADKLFGPVAGHITSFEDYLGSDDPMIGALRTRFHNIALASNGAHGVRAATAVEKTERELFNGWKRGPNGLKAALAANADSVQTFIDDERNFAQYGTREKPQTAPNGVQMPPRPKEVAAGSYYVQASDKTFHWIPKDKIDAAKGIDKTLSVIGQAN